MSPFDPARGLAAVEAVAREMGRLNWEHPGQLDPLLERIAAEAREAIGAPVRIFVGQADALALAGEVGREPLPGTREAARCGSPVVTESMTALPLWTAGAAAGALEVERGNLEESARHFLSILAGKAALALDQVQRARAFRRDLDRKVEELSRLRRCGLLISSRLRLEETLEAILEMALEVTGARYGIFRLVEGPMLVTRAIAGEGLGRPLVDALPIDDKRSVSGWVASHRQAVCIEDIRQEPWCGLYYPLDQVVEMRSEVAVPLLGAGGRLEGVLNLESPLVAGFSEQDRLLLQGLATHAVIAIQQVRLLDALQEVAGRLLGWPRDKVLDRLVELAVELLDPADVAILGPQEPGFLSRLAGTPGTAGDDPIAIEGNTVGEVFSEGLPVSLSDLSAFPWPGLAAERGWRRALLVPILAGTGGQSLGVYALFSCLEEHSREDWDVKVVSCLAHYAGLALENAARSKELAAIQEQRTVAESFAAIGDLAANLLHQLNNKVGIIPVRVQGIEAKCKEALADDPYLARNLHEIGRSAQDAMKVVRDNLGLLRPVRPVPLAVKDAVLAARDSLGLPSTVRVVTSGLDRLPRLAAGERSLSLIFLNLLENAARAMDKSGTITVSGCCTGPWIEICVSDTGCGVDPELHDRIFEFDFSRQDPQPLKLGFGLWWVKTLMARLGGTVSVDSDGRSGATFCLRFPEAAS